MRRLHLFSLCRKGLAVHLAGVFLLSLSLSLSSQEIDPHNTEWMNYLEELAGEGEDDSCEQEIALLFEDLSYLSEHPIDLQRAEREELERLPFLSPEQIENLLYYIYRFGPLVDLYELKNVEALDLRTITYLLPFVCIGEAKREGIPAAATLLKRSRQELIIRSDYTLQSRAGYREATEEEIPRKPGSFYVGDPLYLSFRYAFRYKERIRLNFSGEKDAGEPLWNKYHKGLDSYSFNLELRDMGILKSLQAGDYRLSFGQGLVMNGGFVLGKTSDATRIGQPAGGIKRHTSTRENGFFRGIAANLRISSLELDLFCSSKREDANSDSLTISTFKSDGYNRTPSERNKRRSASLRAGGIHLQWKGELLTVGANAVYYDFAGKRLDPDPQSYNLFYLRGKNSFNAGVHYALFLPDISILGETALDKRGNAATINQLLFTPGSRLRIVLSWRYYAREYNAFFARAFGESTAVRDEQGVYLGGTFRLSRKWEATAYIDRFRFSWLRYGINAPSSGYDGVAQLTFRPNDGVQMRLRYKFKKKSKNQISAGGNETRVFPYRNHRLRYELQSDYPSGLSLKTTLDGNLYSDVTGPQRGFALTQAAAYTPEKAGFHLSGGAGYFHTSAWSSRINIYERNILYAFSFPVYSGEGLRFHLVAKWKANSHFTCYLKVADTLYFDRKKIGSGAEEIDGRNKTDLSALVKYTF